MHRCMVRSATALMGRVQRRRRSVRQGMTLKASLIEATARTSRMIHGSVAMPGTASGCVRMLAGKLANKGSYVYRNHSGHVFEADLTDYMERIGFFGAHSSALVRFIRAQLRPGDWAIDAGANVGLLSSPMAAAVGSQGLVWAVEPLPRNVESLLALKQRNCLEQMEVLPVALSATAGTARLRLSELPGGSGFGSFVAPWMEGGYIEVPTRPLDELVESTITDRPLRFIKMDVEGFEAELLQGARKTLTTWKPMVVCEFHDPLLRAAGSSSEGLLSLFAEYGFHPREPFGRPPGSLDDKVVDMLLMSA